MDMPLTLGLSAGFFALAAFAAWRGAKPFDPRRGPRLAPWRFIMLLAAAVLIFLLGHAVRMLTAGGANT
ncbi:hypothetical protein [Phenylobacterium sp.]|jgi:hypothetical protein|uniref:hypothetical protein n=1 Tax=Phenylobacterium sp. TaxID=1871053 RepID=UPI001202EB05|nr:hypothetical protein [Phenylobacterium sp.]THD55535.1 MAG: hypothetical protein E8A12_15965 [Phenylobacterium sp.]